MASEKTLYWLAVALMALLVGNHFANKYEGSCLADRAAAVVERLSGNATELFSLGQSMFAGSSRMVPEVAMARVQGRFASMQAGIARQQAACARLQAQQARIMALQQMSQIRVICPARKYKSESHKSKLSPTKGQFDAFVTRQRGSRPGTDVRFENIPASFCVREIPITRRTPCPKHRNSTSSAFSAI